MPYHLAVFYGSLGAAAQAPLVADPVVTPSANGALVGSDLPMIARVCGVGALMVRGQLSSITLRQYAPLDCSPINVGTIMGSPVRALHFETSPLPLTPGEELDAYVTNSGAGPTKTLLGVWLTSGPIVPVKGRMFTIHWTCGTALAAADAWSPVIPVLDNGLPGGTFALVGMRFQSATALFARIIPKGAQSARCGVSAVQADGDLGDHMDRYGGMGVMTTLTSTTFPQLEAFANAADATQQGEFDFIQTGA